MKYKRENKFCHHFIFWYTQLFFLEHTGSEGPTTRDVYTMLLEENQAVNVISCHLISRLLIV